MTTRKTTTRRPAAPKKAATGAEQAPVPADQTPAMSDSPRDLGTSLGESDEPDTGVAKPDEAPPAPAGEEPGCNVPDCRRAPDTRGLCKAHWGTHRGYANPREE